MPAPRRADRFFLPPSQRRRDTPDRFRVDFPHTERVDGGRIVYSFGRAAGAAWWTRGTAASAAARRAHALTGLGISAGWRSRHRAATQHGDASAETRAPPTATAAMPGAARRRGPHVAARPGGCGGRGRRHRGPGVAPRGYAASPCRERREWRVVRAGGGLDVRLMTSEIALVRRL